MTIYSVLISEQAYKDIENLQYLIAETFSSPLAAHRYIQGVMAEILSLSYLAESFPISTSRFLLQYGFNARRINYKKMAIIYTVHDKTVLIQRVVPGALVSEI